VSAARAINTTSWPGHGAPASRAAALSTLFARLRNTASAQSLACNEQRRDRRVASWWCLRHEGYDEWFGDPGRCPKDPVDLAR
jgi:hypothetical protein